MFKLLVKSEPPSVVTSGICDKQVERLHFHKCKQTPANFLRVLRYGFQDTIDICVSEKVVAAGDSGASETVICVCRIFYELS